MAEVFGDWIGRSVTRTDVVTSRLLAEYRATMGQWLFDPPDTDHCPPGFHWGLAPATPGVGETGTDGAEANGQLLPPIHSQHRMWAGGAIEFLRAIRVGMAVTRTSALADVKLRRGTSGELYVVSVMHEIADEAGLLVRERQDLVFRDGPAKTAPALELSAVANGSVWTVDPSPLLLFRFSAFTFNGHRIHYDAPYAAGEGYCGLVVHGPLQAALLLNLASKTIGTVPHHFEYRCVAPLFGDRPFNVQVEQGSNPLECRVVRNDGVTTARGQARAQETAPASRSSHR